jgi:hypothetical protein
MCGNADGRGHRRPLLAETDRVDAARILVAHDDP